MMWDWNKCVTENAEDVTKTEKCDENCKENDTEIPKKICDETCKRIMMKMWQKLCESYASCDEERNWTNSFKVGLV